MLLNQLVKINDAGIVADSVNFGLMDDQENNQRLCAGFVFNYDKEKQEESTLGVLEALRSSYGNRNNANVHLLVQQYGKGKSHFAVAIANYFSKPAESPEVQGILHQIENAAGKTSAIAERFRLYKNRGRHLVICLSGDRPGDIRKQFLQSLLKTLEAEGISNSIAQHICSEPLEYLQKLSPGDRAKAETYLESIGNPDGDLSSLMKQLKSRNPAVIPTLKAVAKYVTGFIPEWSATVDIEAILKDLITNACTGESAKFQGILILMDELNFYLQNWVKDQVGSGGTALQNITNICENHKDKVALLSFTQVDPSLGYGIPGSALDDHKRLVSRLAPKGATYQKVASSLELVLDNLLLQDDESPEWQAFQSRWDSALLTETNNAYEKRITIYRQKGWSREKFHKHLTLGCFPLHPLTSYLLCNLAFTVDRTALQFIKKEVKEFIQNQPLTVGQGNNRLNFVYAIALIDTFLESFVSDPNYSKYQEAHDAVSRSDDPRELLVLKALFLFHASGSKIAKTDHEPHEDILASLTGLSVPEVKATLEILEKTRDIIEYKPAEKLYKFWSGTAPITIDQEIESLIKDRKEQDESIERVAIFCQSRVEAYFGSKTIEAKHFGETNKLVLSDWRFEHKVYTIDGLNRALSSDQTLRSTEERGIVAYVVAETQAELIGLRREIDAMLAKSPNAIQQRIAIAISADETGDLAHTLLKIKTLQNTDPAQKRIWGIAACSELSKRWEEQVNTQVDRLLRSCTYHCIGIEKIPPAERTNAQRVISTLLKDLYHFVPPIDGVDKLRIGHTTGRKVISHVCRQLLAENLTAPLPDATYNFVDLVFVTRWKLLKKTSQKYTAQEPTHESIKAAWDEISQWADLGDRPEKTAELQKIWTTLSAPPYGYSEYNFTMLLSGWLTHHRKEIFLKGKSTLQSKGDVVVETKSLKEWAATNILEKPDEFVKKWIITGNAKLIRRKKLLPPTPPQCSIDYLQAEQYLQTVQDYLDAGEPDPAELREIEKVRDKVKEGVNQIQEWFQPVERAESILDTASIETLIDIYPKLLVTLPFNLIEDSISVKATQEQRDRQNQALNKVNEKVQHLIDLESERSESLPNEEAYGSYRANVDRILAQISQSTGLPPRFSETLQYALQSAERRLLELKEEKKVQECLTQIQTRYESLGNTATQRAYQSARQTIESMAQEAPKVRLEETFDQILQDLDQRYSDLNQQLERWEEQSSGLSSSDQILSLRDEINRQGYRFDEDNSVQRITSLLNVLAAELQRSQSNDDALSPLKATLSSASEKLDRIRDKAGSHLPEAFHLYQELAGATLPVVSPGVAAQDYQQKLEEFKAKGRDTLVQRGFAKLYARNLKQISEYNELKGLLQRGLEFIAPHEDFADVRANFEQALAKLEAQYAELQRQEEEEQRRSNDEQLIRSIRSKKASFVNTIQALEESIREVESWQSNLYDPQSFSNDIGQILQDLKSKKAGYRNALQSLNDRLTLADNLRDLNQIQNEAARLDLVFEGSTEYSDFQSLLQSIQSLREDLEKLQSLEARCQQSRSMGQCSDMLLAIAEEKSRLHHGDRFQAKLTTLESSVQEAIQTHTNKLLDFEQQLEFITSVRDGQRFQQEVQSQASRYTQSDLFYRYDIVRNSIRLLIELLQFPDAQKLKILSECQTQLDNLTTWEKDNEPLTRFLQERSKNLRTNFEEAKTNLVKRQQSDAETWLKALETNAMELYRITDDTEKIKQAYRLIEKIERGRDRHFEHLSEPRQGNLNYIVSQCEIEISKDRENQIKALFQQLTRPQRARLYRQLEAYLLDETEVFDG